LSVPPGKLRHGAIRVTVAPQLLLSQTTSADIREGMKRNKRINKCGVRAGRRNECEKVLNVIKVNIEKDRTNYNLLS